MASSFLLMGHSLWSKLDPLLSDVDNNLITSPSACSCPTYCLMKRTLKGPTMAFDEKISMHRKCLSICGYTYPLRLLLFSI